MSPFLLFLVNPPLIRRNFFMMADEGISSTSLTWSLYNRYMKCVSTLLLLMAKGRFETYEVRLWEEVRRFIVWPGSTEACQ